METYINNETLVEDDIYKLFKASVECPLCKNIYIKPMMCFKCQKVYCKRCIDKLDEHEKKCPNNCELPEFKISLDKNEILSKLKFICLGCEIEIPYNEAEMHHNSCCPNQTSHGKISKKKSIMKMKRLRPTEVEQLRKQGKDIVYISGK